MLTARWRRGGASSTLTDSDIDELTAEFDRLEAIRTYVKTDEERMRDFHEAQAWAAFVERCNGGPQPSGGGGGGVTKRCPKHGCIYTPPGPCPMNL
jgi:hypothetical protein